MPIPRSLLGRDEPVDHDLSVVAGAWPAELTGELVISAPHPDTFAGPHTFFGDGMTYRLALEPGRHGAAPEAFAWRQRRIDSPSARLRRRRPDVFTPTMLGLHSPFGLTNAANTAPLPWGDRLFMTWDVGRPVEIDPLSLGFLGEVGHRSEWLATELMPQPVLPMITSTAHPVIDPDRGVLWTVNTQFGGLHVVRWDGIRPVERWPILDAVMPQSVHTITQTRDWLIVADCAFKVEPQVLFGRERARPANHSGPIFLIRKDELEATPVGDPVRAERFELAPEMNHYYADYDDSDGIRVLFEHTENADIAMSQGAGDFDVLGRPCDPTLAGLYGFPMSPDRTVMVEFDPVDGMLQEPRAQLPRSVVALESSAQRDGLEHRGRTRPTAHHMVYQGWRPEGVTQRMLALYRDRVEPSLWPAAETAPLLLSVTMPDLVPTAHHEWTLEDFPSSPIFVPSDPGAPGTSSHAGSRPGGHDGFVVVPLLSDAGFRVEVFDAANVARGPLATIADRSIRVPFLLHAAWLPAVGPAPDAPRNAFADELERVDELPDDLAAATRAVADDLRQGAPIG